MTPKRTMPNDMTMARTGRFMQIDARLI